jgi:hypothetical protein
MCAKNQTLELFIRSVCGKGIAMMLRFYADDSGGSNKDRLRVAGYLMTDKQWLSIDSEIAAALGDLKWFHMKDGNHVEHPEVYKQLLAVIRPESVMAGFSVSLDLKDYKLAFKSGKKGNSIVRQVGTPYGLVLRQLLDLCGTWLVASERTTDWIAYCFESGHPNSGDAHRFMEQLATGKLVLPKLKARYASHNFLAKFGPCSKALIPADILAWHLTRWNREGPQPAELQKLLQVPTRYIDLSASDLATMRDR